MKRPPRVLVVEDNDEVRNVARLHLERAGAVAALCDNGEAAIVRAATFQPDVVVLDVMLPGMDGWTLADKLREHPRTRNVPFVFMSGMDPAMGEKYALYQGAHEYMEKPFVWTRFVERVLQLAEGL